MWCDTLYYKHKHVYKYIHIQSWYPDNLMLLVCMIIPFNHHDHIMLWNTSPWNPSKNPYCWWWIPPQMDIYIYMYMFGLYPYQKSPIPLISSAQLLHCQAICRIGAGRAHVVTWLLGTCHWLLGKLQTFKGQRSMWIYRIKKTYVYVYIYIHRSNILDTVRYEYIICHIKTWGS